MDIRGWTLFACSVAALLTGCQSAADKTPDPASMVFPCQWKGDIDQVDFNEPSGICWHSQRQSLFVVGDEGDICEIKPDGSLVKQKLLRPGADFEGVTHDPDTGLLYVVIEEVESVIEVHPETFAILREFSIPRKFKGKTLLNAGGEGIEAITFVPDSSHAQGGLFYVANQAFTLTDEQDISAILQLELPLRSPKGKARITGYLAPGIIDLSGLYYDDQTKRLMLISDATNTILSYSLDHELISAHAFPGDNQEGVTVDPDGFLYIAQDSGGIIKFKWRD
jgi:uncharacterized protein YjiK